MKQTIATIEQLLCNSIPCQSTVLVDGWVIRLNKGYTYRANCIFPFTDTDSSLDEKRLHYCEQILNHNLLPSIVKLTPDVNRLSMNLLEKNGYRKTKTVNAMVCNIGHCVTAPYIQFERSPSMEWLGASLTLGNVPASFSSIFFQGIQNIAIDRVFAKAAIDQKTVGCAYGTVERDYVGIYDLHAASEHRHHGIGSALCNAILSYGRQNGATKGYLVVHSLNQNAITLYSHLGFQKLYDYHFFIKKYKNYAVIDA